MRVQYGKPIFLTADLAIKEIYSFQERLLEKVRPRRQIWEILGIKSTFIEIDSRKGSLNLLIVNRKQFSF